MVSNIVSYRKIFGLPHEVMLKYCRIEASPCGLRVDVWLELLSGVEYHIVSEYRILKGSIYRTVLPITAFTAPNRARKVPPAGSTGRGVGLGWVGLGRAGLGWIGLGWIRLGWVWLDWVGLGWF